MKRAKKKTEKDKSTVVSFRFKHELAEKLELLLDDERFKNCGRSEVLGTVVAEALNAWPIVQRKSQVNMMRQQQGLAMQSLCSAKTNLLTFRNWIRYCHWHDASASKDSPYFTGLGMVLAECAALYDEILVSRGVNQ